jgi:hypothetical protein
MPAAMATYSLRCSIKAVRQFSQASLSPDWAAAINASVPMTEASFRSTIKIGMASVACRQSLAKRGSFLLPRTLPIVAASVEDGSI